MLINPSPKTIAGPVKDRVRSLLSRKRIHSCGQALSLVVLLTASVASAAPGDARAVQAMLQASSPGSTATCIRDKHGNIVCTIDGKEIEAGDDCTSNMVFGAVGADQGVTLEGSFKPSAGNPVAYVGAGQLLCLQAAQRKDGVLVRALVMAIPTRTVKLCEDNEMCKGADSSIEWKRPTTGIACTLKPNGYYAGDCASGWVEGKDIEEYSMGFKPEDTGG
ncbi:MULTISPECIES: hypothetical protein [Pseudomonas]|jgi:hypothetical protein|uniref:Uncharacterized protein n=2 Tax=Pseudomonas TaxID=286 RepID=A0A0W0I2Y3_PSEFL|nr:MULTISPECIES: hypothetical protein [Pseudomonas]KTB67431.1 hypothetical protein AO063_22265 [Pseudomonas fluorescens ICMP 11288]RMQ87974.1 hypothetical protein ALP97_200098 [Pseudomonas salomonii]